MPPDRMQLKTFSRRAHTAEDGRVARMLLFALLYRLELPPVLLVPVATEKAAYLSALSGADMRHWQPLVEVWRKRFAGGGKK